MWAWALQYGLQAVQVRARVGSMDWGRQPERVRVKEVPVKEPCTYINEMQPDAGVGAQQATETQESRGTLRLVTLFAALASLGKSSRHLWQSLSDALCSHAAFCQASRGSPISMQAHMPPCLHLSLQIGIFGTAPSSDVGITHFLR